MTANTCKKRNLILCNILSLCYLYTLISLSFAFVYMLLSLLGVGSIYNIHSPTYSTFFDLLIDYLYFSTITFTAVGFGDLIPLGVAKIFAFTQALIGYVLPYAIILNYVVYNPKFIKTFLKRQTN